MADRVEGSDHPESDPEDDVKDLGHLPEGREGVASDVVVDDGRDDDADEHELEGADEADEVHEGRRDETDQEAKEDDCLADAEFDEVVAVGLVRSRFR